MTTNIETVEQRPAIVHIITQLELGGAQRNTLHTVKNLDSRRFKASLICGPGGILDEEARSGGMDVTFCPSLQRAVHPQTDWRALTEIRTALLLLKKRTHGKLLVHTHSSKAGVLGRIAARQAGAHAVVHTVHGFGFHAGQSWPVRTAYALVERALSGSTDAMLFVSRRDMETAEKLHLVAKEGGHLVRSGIDLSAFHPDEKARAAIRAELGIPLASKLLVTVGNFKPQKNPMLGLRAFAHVAAARADVCWLFV